MKREDVIQLAMEACDKTKVGAFYNGYWTITQDELERVIHIATQKAVAEEAAKALSQLQQTVANAAPAVPQDMRLVPVWLLERVEQSLGSFTSDEGWSQSDMDTMDSVSAMLAATPAPAPAQEVGLTESERVKCLVDSGCIGTVKMTYDSGPYEITRTSINSDRLIDSVIAALRAKGASDDRP